MTQPYHLGKKIITSDEDYSASAESGIEVGDGSENSGEKIGSGIVSNKNSAQKASHAA